jgi:hypothetical protein
MFTESRITLELPAFNEAQGTQFNQNQLVQFNEYKDHYGLSIDEAFEYIQSCHCCDNPLQTFAGEYCCGSCFYHVEELGTPCFRGDDCLICNRPPLLPEDAVLVDEGVYGYSSYERIKEVLNGYVGKGKTQELLDSYVVEDDGCWIVIRPIKHPADATLAPLAQGNVDDMHPTDDKDSDKFMVSMYAPVAAKYMARRFDLFTCYLLYNKYQEVI